MTDNDKRKWRRMEKDDKKRYENEMEKYKPSPGYSTNGKLLPDLASANKCGTSTKGGTSTKRTFKKVRDPNAPAVVKYRNSFQLYQAEERRALHTKDPTASFGDISKKISGKWSAIGEGGKKVYGDRLDEDRRRYEEEVRPSEERSDELPTLLLGTKAARAPTFVQDVHPL